MYHRKPAMKSGLDDVIETAISELKGHDAHTEDYEKIVDQLTKLEALRTTKSDKLSKDTLAIVLGNLAGVLVIVGYEQKHLLTSKALPFIGKFK